MSQFVLHRQVTNRCFFAGSTFTLQSLLCGVPQGSVCGPLMFILYCADVIEITARNRADVRAYADDLQIHASCTVSDQQTANDCLLACVSDVDQLMFSSRLAMMELNSSGLADAGN